MARLVHIGGYVWRLRSMRRIFLHSSVAAPPAAVPAEAQPTNATPSDAALAAAPAQPPTGAPPERAPPPARERGIAGRALLRAEQLLEAAAGGAGST